MKKATNGWTDYTFNPWIGCTEAGPGCLNCYARTLDKFRHWTPEGWGKGKPRRITSDAKWREPIKWNHDADLEGKRKRVLCASLADVFDAEAPEGARDRLWDLIRRTPNLAWMLLTKRPENIKKYLPADWGTGYANVWLGVTCEDRKHGYTRLDVLRTVPARKLFVCCDPLLEDVSDIDLSGIDWVMAGGESGRSARKFELSWVRRLRGACSAAGVKFFIKQLGSKPIDDGSPFRILQMPGGKRDRDGKHIKNFPRDLRIRQTPDTNWPGPKHLPYDVFLQVVRWLNAYPTRDLELVRFTCDAHTALFNLFYVERESRELAA
jgi:protein gp37